MAIFPRKFRCMMGKLLTKTSCKSSPCMESSSVPSGCFAVYAGEEHKGYVIPVACLSSIMFNALLNPFEEEIQDLHKTSLSCSVQMFEAVLDLAKSDQNQRSNHA